MSRFPQIIFIAITLCWCWLGMQIFHELGHVIGGLLTGAKIEKIYLHPFSLSRTVLAFNPKPLTVVWMGSIIGVLLPFLLYLFAKFSQIPKLYMFRLFSGFCCIANGVYICFGFGYPSLDSGLMRSLGTPLLLIFGFSTLTIPLGLYLWHDQLDFLGFGRKQGRVNTNDIYISTLVLISIIITEILYSLL